MSSLISFIAWEKAPLFFILFIPFISQHDDYFLYIVILVKKKFDLGVLLVVHYQRRMSIWWEAHCPEILEDQSRCAKVCTLRLKLWFLVPLLISTFFLHYEIPSCAFFSVQSITFSFFLDWHTTSSLVQGFSHFMWFLGVQH